MLPSQARYLRQWQEQIQDQEATARSRAAHARLVARDLESALTHARERLQHEQTGGLPTGANPGAPPPRAARPLRDALTAERIARALRSATVPTVIVDSEGLILFANDAWHRVMRVDRHSDVGMDYFSTLGEGVAPTLHRSGEPIRSLRAVLQGARASYRCDVTHQHPSEVYLLDAAGLPDGGAVMTHTDITALRRQLAESEQRALHDDLTGLLSHQAFHEQASQVLAAATRYDRAVHVLMIDLDAFKQVNDQFGHQAGDRVLIEVASRLRHAVRDGDLVGRLGGDEFAILAHEVHDPPEFCQRVQASLIEPFRHRGHLVTLTASVGMVAYPQDGNTPRELLQAADVHMYHHKRTREG